MYSKKNVKTCAKGIAHLVLTVVSLLMVAAELMAGFDFSVSFGYLSIPILLYMVTVAFSGLFSLKIGVYYELEVRNSLAASLL